MVVIELGVIVGVYAGSRLIERWRGAPLGQPVRKKSRAMAEKPEQAEAAANLAEHTHHTFFSSATALSTSIGYILFPKILLLNVALVAYSTVPIVNRAEKILRREKSIQNDAYSAIVSGLCLASGQYFAGAMHNTIYHVGSRLVGESKEQAHTMMGEAMLQHPEQVWVLRDGGEIELPLEQVLKGDLISVRSGEVVPLDGIIQQGRGLVDQQALTGELQPREKHPGDFIAASSLLLSGQIRLVAECDGVSGRQKQLDEVLRNTREYKTKMQLRGEAWSNRAAIPLLGASALIWPLAGTAPATALLFSAPTNTVRAMLSLQTSTHLRWAADQGILIKDGRVLEELPWIDTVLFDKTGTLTQSQPEVAKIIPCGALNETRLLAIAAAAEQRLSHPIADALLAEAKRRDLDLPQVESRQYDLGLGVTVHIENREVHVGSSRFIQEITGEKDLPADIARAMRMGEGHSFVLVAVNRRIEGALELYPRVRPEVPAVIRELRERKIRHLAMVSGDARAPCERLSRELGLDEVYAETMPQDKANLIRSLQAQGRRVCFIGDGLNDAIAMKQANASICLASASELTHNLAQVVLVNDDLSHLRDAFDLSAHLHLRLGTSLGYWVSFGLFNAICVPLLSFTPLQSSLLYAGAFSLGFQQSRNPGWLDRPNRHPLQTPEEDPDNIISTGDEALSWRKS